MPPFVLGPVKVHPLIDAAPAPVDVAWSFPDVPGDEWDSVELSGLDDKGRFAPSLGAFLIETPQTLVLCDAGIGPGPNAYLDGLAGNLPQLIAAAGFSADDVEAVVFTHLHMDHIGWAAVDGAPRFPRATYYAPADDAAFFAAGAPGMGAHHIEAFNQMVAPLLEKGRVTLLQADAEILPGFAYRATPGHTPGHQSILVRAGDETLAVCGDVFHAPAQVERPEWSHRADHDPSRARATRRAFLDEAAAKGFALAAGHFREGLQFGRIGANAEGLCWRPLACEATNEGPDERADDLTTGG